MTDYELKQGEKYFFFSKGNPKGVATYVRKEHLPKIGGDWETFYNLVLLACEKISPRLIRIRIRLPVEKIVEVSGMEAKCDGELVRKIISKDIKKHTPIVGSWLAEVNEIEGKERIIDAIYSRLYRDIRM